MTIVPTPVTRVNFGRTTALLLPLFLLTLLTGGPAHATDAGIIAATLPTKAAACQYLTHLVAQARSLVTESKALTAAVSDADLGAMTSSERLQVSAEFDALLAKHRQTRAELAEVMTIMRAKYGDSATCKQ
jgi:TRAP-type C4-dicarboxylate transport system permease large subunit